MPTLNPIFRVNNPNFSTQHPSFPRVTLLLDETMRARGRKVCKRITGDKPSNPIGTATEPLSLNNYVFNDYVFHSDELFQPIEELISALFAQSMQTRSDLSPDVQNLYDYLTSLSIENDIAENTKRLAWEAWQQLSEMMGGNLSVPDAASGPDGEVFYAWDEHEHHLSLEILPGGAREFFYRNRDTRKVWAVDYLPGESTTTEKVKDALQLFT